jgi:glycosyltransferase involved in cell wall biosynthesis
MGLSCAIVINSYNYGRYLAQAVDCALATRAIVVVVDDGSTDEARRWNALETRPKIELSVRDRGREPGY